MKGLIITQGTDTVLVPGSSAGVAVATQASSASPKRAPKLVTVYRAGDFVCDDEDLRRMSSRYAWLSGHGLSVFARAQLLAAGVQDVSVCHSRLLYDVAYVRDTKAETGIADDRVAAATAPIETALANVGLCINRRQC